MIVEEGLGSEIYIWYGVIHKDVTTLRGCSRKTFQAVCRPGTKDDYDERTLLGTCHSYFSQVACFSTRLLGCLWKFYELRLHRNTSNLLPGSIRQ